MAKITYYDFSDIDYASFFVQGFLQLHDQAEHRFQVSKRIPDELEGLDLPTWITYRKPASTSVFRYESSGSNFLFCIDANDHNGLDPNLPDIYPGYHMRLIERVRYYFKVNYNEEAIASHPTVTPFVHKIIPTPLVIPLRVSKMRSLLPNVTPFKGQRLPLKPAKRRMQRLKQLLPLNEYRRLRQLPRDLDVFFITTIYSGNDHEQTNAWRLALLQALSEYSHLNTLTGFISRADDLPSPFAKFQLQPMPFETYMSQLARSKIGVYIRGTFDGLSFKFGQYFALGKPIVGESLLNNRKNMYAYDSFPEQFKYDEPKAIADRICELIADPVKLQHLRETNTATFEKQFTPEAVVRQIIKRIEQDLRLQKESVGG